MEHYTFKRYELMLYIDYALEMLFIALNKY
jgi:hypothetical protein